MSQCFGSDRDTHGPHLATERRCLLQIIVLFMICVEFKNQNYYIVCDLHMFESTQAETISHCF